LDKPTNALSWGRKPAAFTKLIELTHRLFEAPAAIDNDPAEPHCFNLFYDLILGRADMHPPSVTLPSSFIARFFLTQRRRPVPMQPAETRESAGAGSYTYEPDPLRLEK
jgi:hypothetical protein